MRRQINAEELNALFASIGEGIWHLQNVEDALHTYITIKRDIKLRGSVTPDVAEMMLAKHRKKTLGASLRIAQESKVLTDTLQTALEKFKEERDWLVHRSVHEKRGDLYVDEDRRALMERIGKFTVQAKELQKAITAEMKVFGVSQGIKREWIEQEAQRRITRLTGNPKMNS
jgi:hypothetical protein